MGTVYEAKSLRLNTTVALKETHFTDEKLRKQFEIYPEALEATVKLANDLEHTHSELLKRIQAERQH